MTTTRPTWRRHAAPVFAAIAVLALTAAAQPVRASVFELFGAGARGVALGGALAASAEGPDATFYNPAALAFARSQSVSIGMAATSMQLRVHLARPICQDAADRCSAASGGAATARYEPLLPSGGSHLQLGWNGRHPTLAGGRVAFGFALTLPSRGLIHLSGPDARQPHFPLLESLADRISVRFATGVRVHQRVSLGLGVQILASLGSVIDASLDPAGQRLEPAAVTISLQPTVRMTAGVLVEPIDGLRLGLGVRQEMAMHSRIPSQLRLGSLVGANMLVAQDTLFSPWTFELGAAWRGLGGRLGVMAGLRVALWSALPDPSPRVVIDVGGGAAGQLGLDDLADVGTRRGATPPNANTTVSPSLGVEALLHPRWTARLGYGYRPAALPRAIDATNLLDNPVHAIGVGCELGLGAALAAADGVPPQHRAFVQVAAQLQIWPRQAVYKTDPEDVEGNLDHGGWIAHGVVQAGVRF